VNKFINLLFGSDKETRFHDISSFDSFVQLWNSRSFSFIYDGTKRSCLTKFIKNLYNSAILRLCTVVTQNQLSFESFSDKTHDIARRFLKKDSHDTRDKINRLANSYIAKNRRIQEKIAVKDKNSDIFCSSPKLNKFDQNHSLLTEDLLTKQQDPLLFNSYKTTHCHQSQSESFSCSYEPKRSSARSFTHSSAKRNVDSGMNISVGSIYTLYMLYFTQPSTNHRVRIYTPLSCLDRLTDTVRKIVVQSPNHDVIQCIQRLVSENAIIPGALNIIDDNLRPINQSNQEIRNMLCILGREAKTLFIIENLRTIGAAYFLKRSRFMCLLPNFFNPIVDAHLSEPCLKYSPALNIQRARENI
jgi:hypothetical protein